MALSMRVSLQSFPDLGMRRAKMLESCPRPHPSPGRMRLETSRADVCISAGTKVNPIYSSTQERKSACATAHLIPIPHFSARHNSLVPGEPSTQSILSPLHQLSSAAWKARSDPK